MSARSTQNYRQDGNNKGFNRAPRRYVAKNQNLSTQEPVSNSNPNLNAPLTSSLRETDPSSAITSTSSTSSSSRVRVEDNGKWISSRNQVGNFVNYLPQDEAVATGLGAEDGGLDPVESQRVVDLLNRELSRLLKLNSRDFWKEVAGDTSLHDFLDSFLQFRKRWYDFPHHGAKGLVAGVVIGELELSRRVFMVLYRISSNRDPGARASDSLSAKEHAALLQEKRLLHLPKLLDICAVYGHENEELTRLLVTNAMQAQPTLHENLSAVVSRFLSVVQTMHQRCVSLLETVHSGGHNDHGENQLHEDFLEVMDFINDGVATLDAFVNAYRPAALYLSCPVEMSYGSGELLGTLARLHDSLLPSLQRGFGLRFTAEGGIQNSGGGSHAPIVNSLKILSMRIITFSWKLLDLCYLSNEIFEGPLPLLTVTKMFPANVEDPVIRGDILVQTFREINGEASRHAKENNSTGTLLQKVQSIYKVLSRLDELRSSGWILMDTDQFQYITLLLMPPADAVKKNFPLSASMGNKVQMDENTAIMESKISQIKDLFPDYGKGFLAACLEVYNQNPEEVIQRILEGTLHEELQAMDISLDKVPPPKSASAPGRSDKGKGVVQVNSPSPVVAAVAARRTEGPSSSASSSPLAGRFTRKTKTDVPNPSSLDSRAYEESSKTALLASQYEYEDEYDDSFDDLGLGVVESGYEERENVGERIKSAPGKSWGSETENPAQNKSGPKWNTRKTPQFYVKDGKNYSYKVSGAVAVRDSQEAALLHEVQREQINGLGRGGNLPHGAVKRWTESKEQEQEEDEEVGGSEMGGRGGGPGGSRGRGRRGGGGRNHNRKDRAIKKHFAGLGGF